MAGWWHRNLQWRSGDSPRGSTRNRPGSVRIRRGGRGHVAHKAWIFSSNGSSDPEGTALSYSWNFGDGSVSTAANPGHTYTNAGSFDARLTVSDGTNSTLSTNLTIKVSAVLRANPTWRVVQLAPPAATRLAGADFETYTRVGSENFITAAVAGTERALEGCGQVMRVETRFQHVSMNVTRLTKT